MDDVRFFTISSSLYFPGFVALFNSLRLAGHTEPVTVLERGMSEAQKEAIRSHCNVVSLEAEVVNPRTSRHSPSSSVLVVSRS